MSAETGNISQIENGRKCNRGQADCSYENGYIFEGINIRLRALYAGRGNISHTAMTNVFAEI